ncbi:protein kinase [bacterium AH-315-N03]|nr:protein kinase [bacterium AH-315-N03]
MSRIARRRAAAAFTPGTLIDGRYSLEEKLGEGGMAEVFAATDAQTGRRLAIKILHADIATNPEAVERTKREGQLLKELDNPAIVNVETFGQLDDGSVFLVMELLEGETLGERMRRGTLDPVELAPIVAGMCAGLHAAHVKGVVHRDLKPDNVFLCPTDHGLQVKLLDFGISKVYGSEKLTQTGEVLGTPRYMSPEQLGAEPDVDARVDVYALGVILYEALAGKPPFLAVTPTELIIAILNGKVTPLGVSRPDCPAEVEGVVMRAMSKGRAARYETAMQLADAYINAVGGARAVRAQQRRGMPTQAFGGMKIESAALDETQLPGTQPSLEQAKSDGVAGHLKLGTFSGLEAPPPSGDMPLPPDGGTRQMGASPGAIVPPNAQEAVVAEPQDEQWDRGGAAKRRSVPHTREVPMEAIPTTPIPGASAPSRPIAPTAMMEASQALPAVSSPEISIQQVAAPPRNKARFGVGKFLLVAGALVAGAISAGAVILTLSLTHDHDHDDGETTSEVVGQPAEPQSPTHIVAQPEEPVVAQPAADPPEAVAVPAEPEVEEEEEEEHHHRRRRRRRRSEPQEQDTPAPDNPGDGNFLPGFGGGGGSQDSPPPDDNSPAVLLRRARRELRQGHAAQCVSTLDDAIANGAPAIALARRGDCYEAMGQRGLAIRDYQRFCRIAHDHPAIAEIRPRLESWGQRCQ